MTQHRVSDSLNPRKLPGQTRATKTVEAILEAAAEVLDRVGLDGYNTNYIAERAGVSIGSLYQYFPTKEAITAALIESGHQRILASIAEISDSTDWRRSLRHVITVAAEHQLSRPQLAKLLDFEEARLSIAARDKHIAMAVRELITRIVTVPAERIGIKPTAAASDIMAMTRALSDAASHRGDTDIEGLQCRISRAVFGYFDETSPSAI